MKYIFEDKKDDIISKLFQMSYTEETVNREFIYTRGNGRLVEESKNQLNNTTDAVMVFVDVVPDNNITVEIYLELSRLAKHYMNRLIVVPILCSEYILIRALCKSNIIDIRDEDVEVCINKDEYRNTALYNKPDSVRFCKNLEKYCKLVLMNKGKNCTRHTRTDNPDYKVYYTEDCLCSHKEGYDNRCRECKLTIKSGLLLKEYPVIPSGCIHTEFIGKTSMAEFKEMINDFIDEHNKNVAKIANNRRTTACKQISEHYKY